MNANFFFGQAGDAAPQTLLHQTLLHQTPRQIPPRHFSDTRTGEGRVRFLLAGGRAELLAEGPGWSHRSTHASLQDAANFLAVLPQVSQPLYEEALAELGRRLRLEQAA